MTVSSSPTARSVNQQLAFSWYIQAARREYTNTVLPRSVTGEAQSLIRSWTLSRSPSRSPGAPGSSGEAAHFVVSLPYRQQGAACFWWYVILGSLLSADWHGEDTMLCSTKWHTSSPCPGWLGLYFWSWSESRGKLQVSCDTTRAMNKKKITAITVKYQLRGILILLYFCPLAHTNFFENLSQHKGHGVAQIQLSSVCKSLDCLQRPASIINKLFNIQIASVHLSEHCYNINDIHIIFLYSHRTS